MKQVIFAFLAMTIGIVTAQNGTVDLSPIANLGSYSTLLQAIASTGADQDITENVPVTILGPTDDAFSLISSLMNGMTDAEIKQILLSHVIVGTAYTSDKLRKDGGCVVVTTAGGTKVSLFLDPTNDEMDIDGIPVVDKDVVGDFGAFIGIEQAIIPGQHSYLECPSEAPSADLEPIRELGKYNRFLEALNQTGIATILGQYNATIFAPTDEAFAAVDLSGLSADELSDVFKNHLVFAQDIFSYQVTGTGCVEATASAGRRIAVRFDEATGSVTVNGIPLNTDLDVTGEFGVMHGLTAVLTDASSEFVTCLDFGPIVDNGNYNTFIEVLKQSKVTETIGLVAPLTIFGPTDAALAAAQDTLATLTEDELDEILNNHIIYYEIDSQQIMVDLCIEETAASGMKLSIRYDSETDSVTVNGIPVVDTDIGSRSFGIFHGIDGLLIDGVATYTPCLDFSPILETGDHDVFVAALFETSVAAMINVFKPATLFAPTDSALATIDQSLLTEEVLSNHVIFDEISAADVIAAGCVNVYSAGDLPLDIRYNSETGKGTVNGIPIVSYDTEGGYGVMHGLDGVLIKGVTPSTPCVDFSPIENAGNYGAFMDILNQTEQNVFISFLAPVDFFAPTDAALAAAEDALGGLSEEELMSVLESHIIGYPSNLTLELVESEGCVEGFTYGYMEVSIRYNATSGTMGINGIPVLESIVGNYGKMHGISGVIGIDGEYEPCPIRDDDFTGGDDILPPGEPTFNILDELASEFQTPILDAILAADETTATIFGPTDEAFFAHEGPETESEVLQILKGHIVAGTVTSDQIKAEGCMVLDTIAGTKIRVMVVEEGNAGRRLAGHMGGGMIMVNDAKVILADQQADGALIHGIDKLILPGSFEECPSMAAPTTAPAGAPPSSSGSGGFSAGLLVLVGCIIAIMAF